jgi:hypothetical protein
MGRMEDAMALSRWIERVVEAVSLTKRDSARLGAVRLPSSQLMPRR